MARVPTTLDTSWGKGVMLDRNSCDGRRGPSGFRRWRGCPHGGQGGKGGLNSTGLASAASGDGGNGGAGGAGGATAAKAAKAA